MNTPAYQAVLDKMYHGPMADLMGVLIGAEHSTPYVFLRFEGGEWAAFKAYEDQFDGMNMEFVRDRNSFDAYELYLGHIIDEATYKAQVESEAEKANMDMQKREQREYERLKAKFEKK